MGEELTLIVATAAPVNSPVANNRIEWRIVPSFERLGRLHIVMAVENHAGFRIAPADFGEHRLVRTNPYRFRGPAVLREKLGEISSRATKMFSAPGHDGRNSDRGKKILKPGLNLQVHRLGDFFPRWNHVRGPSFRLGVCLFLSESRHLICMPTTSGESVIKLGALLVCQAAQKTYGSPADLGRDCSRNACRASPDPSSIANGFDSRYRATIYPCLRT